LEETATATVAHNFQQTFTLAATTFALKIVLRAAERGWAFVRVGDSSVASAYINLTTGAIGTVGGSAVDVTSRPLADSCWEMTFKASAFVAGSNRINIYSSTANLGATYTGTLGSGIYVGPVILVDGVSEVGSLIPSGGTRAADTCSLPSTFLSGIKDRGYLEVEYTPNAATGNARVFFDTITGSTGVALYIATNGAITLEWNGSVRNTGVLTWTPGVTYRPRLEWNGLIATVKRDGAIGYGPTAQAAAPFTTINANFYVGCNRTGIFQCDGSIKSITAGPLPS
jgi:hypothetical protein